MSKVKKKGLFSYGQDIVMAFSPSVVGCLVNNGFQKGGHRHPRTPPCLRPCYFKTYWNPWPWCGRLCFARGVTSSKYNTNVMERTSNEQYVVRENGFKKRSKLTFLIITAVDPNWLYLLACQWYHTEQYAKESMYFLFRRQLPKQYAHKIMTCNFFQLLNFVQYEIYSLLLCKKSN